MSKISLEEGLFTARAIRRLETTPIPRVDLEYVVEAATMAPSAGNMQLWSFVVVTDREQMSAIAEAHREAGGIYIREGVLADPDIDEERRRVYKSALHNVDHLDQAGAIIVACLTMPCPDDAQVASGLFGSIFPAVQNLILAARGRGLGTVLITLASDYSPVKPKVARRVRDLLDLPKHVRAAALVPIGYPQRPFGRPDRRPFRECLHWQRWGGAPSQDA